MTRMRATRAVSGVEAQLCAPATDGPERAGPCIHPDHAVDHPTSSRRCTASSQATEGLAQGAVSGAPAVMREVSALASCGGGGRG